MRQVSVCRSAHTALNRRSALYQSYLYVQFKVIHTVLPLQEAVFVLIYRTLLETGVPVKEVGKGLPVGLMVAEHPAVSIGQQHAFHGRVRTVVNLCRTHARCKRQQELLHLELVEAVLVYQFVLDSSP